MARYKIIHLLLLTYFVYVSCEEQSNNAESRVMKPPDKLVLQKSEPYPTQAPSFMSRIASWLFPWGSGKSAQDSVPAETHHGGPQYLPPIPEKTVGCNPCNREPWVPMATNHGQNTVINFLPPSSQFGSDLQPPPPVASHGLPPIHFKPIPEKLNYGLPKSPPTQYIPLGFNSEPNNGGAVYSETTLKDYMVPPPFKPLRNNFRVNKPPKPSNNPIRLNPVVTHLKPIPINYEVPIEMQPPPFINGNDLGNSYSTLPSTVQYVNNENLPVAQPSDSYGNPVTGIEYFGPIEQLPLSSNLEFNKPIPLPNLNSGPVLPIHNPQKFREANYDQAPASNVEVIPSITVGDYLSSVEHPINVIQSPIVEVSVDEKNADKDQYESGDKDHQNNNEKVKLSENPIIVEDTYTAASAINATYQNSNENVNKRGNDQDLGIVSFQPEIIKSPTPLVTESYRSQSPSSNQITINLIKELLLKQQNTNQEKIEDNKTTFTPPPLDYGKWKPSWGPELTTSMVPPPITQSTWLIPVTSQKFEDITSTTTTTTTKRPKQVQIIIPYINNKTPAPFNYNSNQGRRVPLKSSYTTLVPIYTPPSSTTAESIWLKFIDDFNLAQSKKVTATAFQPTSTVVSNIRDLLKDTNKNPYQSTEQLPFDIISLQNNIDDWTQQEYANKQRFNSNLNQKSTISSRFVQSKKIPDKYFTTEPYTEATTSQHFDYEPAGSKIIEKDIESNLIFSETTTEAVTTTTTSPSSTETTTKVFPSPFSPKGEKSLWDIAQVTVSPITKEKVYIVTPLPYNRFTPTPPTAWSLPPRIQNGQVQNSTSNTKFLIRVEPENMISREKLKNDTNNALTVVFSEWPHLINNLQTTTTMKSTSRHPLLGLMDLSSYTPPPNSTVQTIAGHSRVVTVVTPKSNLNTKSTIFDEKKVTA